MVIRHANMYHVLLGLMAHTKKWIHSTLEMTNQTNKDACITYRWRQRPPHLYGPDSSPVSVIPDYNLSHHHRWYAQVLLLLLLLHSMWWLCWLDLLFRECRIFKCQENILCRPPELGFDGRTSGPYLLPCSVVEWAGLQVMFWCLVRLSTGALSWGL